MVMIYLIQNSIPLHPGVDDQLTTARRMAAQAALLQFQNLTYEALGR
jgi:hypothetical protein